MEAWRDELYHFGVKGMRWGVRRYQNYDGTYTQRGLKRYSAAAANTDYAKKQLDLAKDAHRQNRKSYEGKNLLKNTQGAAALYESKRNLREAKSNYRQAKRIEKEQYKQLKLDKRADEGKKLYQQGHTIDEYQSKAAAAQRVVTLVGGMAAATAFAKYGNKRVAVIPNIRKTQYYPINGKQAGMAIALGTIALNGMIQGAANHQSNKLRAYYAH